MAFAPGTPRPENSGRKKGSRNKRNIDVIAVFDEFEYDPAASILKRITDPKSDLTDKERTDADLKLMKFKYPELRSVEHSGQIDQELKITTIEDFLSNEGQLDENDIPST